MHLEEFEAIMAGLTAPRARSGLSSRLGHITSHFQRRANKKKSVSELRDDVRQGIAAWVVQTSSPIAAVLDPSFRQMFRPLHDKADDILKIGNHSIREEIIKLGMVAMNATSKELLKNHVFSLTTDHWTSLADDTSILLSPHTTLKVGLSKASLLILKCGMVTLPVSFLDKT